MNSKSIVETVIAGVGALAGGLLVFESATMAATSAEADIRLAARKLKKEEPPKKKRFFGRKEAK